MFSLKSICSRIQVDKASINKINNKSSFQTKSMKYSQYVNPRSRNYRTITEGQVTSITMTYVTPHTATVVFTYVSNPVYFEMVLVNIQDATDTHVFEVYASPYTFTGLRPNSYYTITTYATFVSTNTYSKVYPSAIKTLFEGPPTDLSMVDIFNIRATLYFTPSIGNPTNFTLNIIDTKDPTNILFFQNQTPPFSPFFITGLQPDITYDITLSSYYSATNNTYTVYKPAYFQTYRENYPVLNSIHNITNVGATITIEYTGTPSYNSLQLINVNDSTDTYTITDTQLNNTNTFNGLRVDSSYNLTVTSVYITEHTLSISQPNAFHTWNENVIPSAQIIEIFGNEIRISYTAAIGKVLDYIVSLTDTNDNTFTQSFQNVPNYVLFSNLEVYTNYTLTIATVYILNTYLYTYPTYIQTLNEGPVIDISYSNISNTSAVISFPASPGIDMTYNITYKGERNNTKSYSINGLTSTAIRLTGLSIYTPYSVIITTQYLQNSYTFGIQTLFTTLNEGATTISNLTVQTNNNAIAITIINTYGNPRSYSFYATSSSSVNIVGIYIGLANTQYTYTLSGLSVGVPYTVSVVTEYDTENSYKTIWPLTITL